jgi:hypothetical protein
VNTLAVPSAYPAVIPQPLKSYPSVGEWIALLITALVGSVALAPLLVALWFLAGPLVLLIVWCSWLALAAPFAFSGPANALGRSIAGWREPNEHERAILHHACVRACVAAGADARSMTLRIARGSFNAHSSGRSVLATTEDVISGDHTADLVELEAMLAHELAHHRQGDLLLSGPRWWLLAPLAIVDRLCRLLGRIPLVGRLLVAAVQLPFRILIFPLRAVTSVATRPRELLADRYAVDCGYGVPLERVLSRFMNDKRDMRAGLVGWMLATHPGPADRITHVRNADSAAGRRWLEEGA